MADYPIPLTPEAAVELWSRDDRRARHVELGLCVDCLGPKPDGEDCDFCTRVLPYIEALTRLGAGVWDIDSETPLDDLPPLTDAQRADCEQIVAAFRAGREASCG